jgi:plastocyanin
MRIRIAIVATLVAVTAVWSWSGTASAGGGCLHGTAASEGAGTVVEMVDECFTPTVLHVDPGTTVTFVNRDGVNHQVAGVGDTWGSLTELLPDDRVTYTFVTDGVYLYSCWLHPGMVGAVVAGSGAGSGGLQELSVTGGTVSGSVEAAPPAASTTSPSDGGTLGALLIGGMLGLMAGGGLAATVLRRRRAALELSSGGPAL